MHPPLFFYTNYFLKAIKTMGHYDDLAVIILAAGKGTRMKSDLAKVLHKVAGKSMVLHVIECAQSMGCAQIHVVVGHQAEDVKAEINSHFKVNFALQKQLLGTGDAVKAAVPNLDDSIHHILVLCGDVPLIRSETMVGLVEQHLKRQSDISVLAVDLDDPYGYGRMVLDKQDNLICIREEADANDQEKKINKVNTGIFCFKKKFLVRALGQLKPENNQAEYYLTDTISIAKQEGKSILTVTMDDPNQVIGVNTLDELARVELLLPKSVR